MSKLYPTTDVRRSLAHLYEFVDMSNNLGLYPNQEFVRRFMAPHTPFAKRLLLWHEAGSGKTIIIAAICTDCYFAGGNRSLIVTKGDSGSVSIQVLIRQYHNMAGIDVKITKMFDFEHYMALHNKVSTYSDDEIISIYDGQIFVFDEIHNVREINPKGSVYQSIQRMITLCENSPVILSTATPMVDSADEMESILNLIPDGYISYNPIVHDKPVLRFMGKRNDETIPKVQLVTMIGHQKKINDRELSRAKVDDLYRYPISIALFSLPGGRGMNLIERTVREVVPGRGKSRHVTFLRHSVEEGMRKYMTGNLLRQSSCKYHKLLENIAKADGPVFVTEEDVHGHGLLLLSVILEENGYDLYYGQQTYYSKKMYTICVGSSDICPNMQSRLDAFNSAENADGSVVMILLGSRVIGESISLMGVRQVHCMSPYWNYQRLLQAIARASRSKSHSRLPSGKRFVDVYVYVADESVDVIKLERCKAKQTRIREVEKDLIERSIEKYVKFGSWDEDTDARSFVLYRMDMCEAALFESIGDLISEEGGIAVGDILRALNYPSDVVMEGLYRMVTRNVPIRDKFYLREDGKTFFLVRDPSTPFVSMIPIPSEDETIVKRIRIPKNIVVDFDDANAMLSAMRSMSVSDKIDVLESSSRDIGVVKKILKYLCHERRGITYHVLCYRDLHAAYKAAVPFPIAPIGKTRIYDPDTGSWDYIDDLDEETHVLGDMERRYRQFLRRHDGDTLAIISVIDGKLRVKRGEAMEDARKILRGRCLSSMKKMDCFSEFRWIPGISPDMRSKDMISLIEEYYISAGKYVMV